MDILTASMAQNNGVSRMEGTTGENAISSARAASSTSSSTPDSQALAFAVAALQALPNQEERWSPPRQQRTTPRVVSSKPLPQLPRSATQAALRKKPAVPRLFFPTKQLQPPMPFEEQQRKDHEEHQATPSGSSPLPAPLFAPLFSSFPPTSAAVSGQQQAYPVLVAASSFPSVSPLDLKSYAGAADSTSAAAKNEPNKATDQHPEDDDGTHGEDDHDEAARLQRSRERNREHARRTRLRKKAALQELQNKIARLKATKASLQQQIQDQSIASILLGLNNNSSATEEGAASADTTRTTTPVLDHETEGQLHGGTNKNKRKRSSSSLGATSATQKPLQVRIAGKGVVTIQSQVNWKTGTYMDEAGMTQKLTPEELELLRRERNRRHAKMTRDRKKNFLLSMEQTVEELEREIAILRHSNEITPHHSPEMEPEPAPKRQCDNQGQHGFSLLNSCGSSNSRGV